MSYICFFIEKEARCNAGTHRPKSDEGDPLDHQAAFVAAWKAGRAAIAATQRSRLGMAGRPILKSTQRLRIGAQAMSAMVSLPSAR